MHARLVGLAALALALTGAPSAGAAPAGQEVYVGGCGADSYDSIQDAIDAVDTPDSTVWVCPGDTYSGGFSVEGKAGLTIRNLPVKNRPAPVVELDSLVGVTIDDSSGTTIRGLRLSNALIGIAVGPDASDTTLRSLSLDDIEFGMLADDADGLVIERTVFTGAGDSSFALVAEGGSGVEVSDNRVIGAAFGIVVESDGALVRDNGVVGTAISYAFQTIGSTVSGNRAKFGEVGFLFADTGSTNRVVGNVARANGVGMAVGDTGSRFGRNLVRSNRDVDVVDSSNGSGTAGTANTWKRTECDVSTPAGICGEAPDAAPRVPDLAEMHRRIDEAREKVGR